MELPPGPHRPGWNILRCFFPHSPNLSLVLCYRQPPPLPSPFLFLTPRLTLPSCGNLPQHLPPPPLSFRCFLCASSSSSPCLTVRLLLVMKSSEQVFNKRRISNYCAAVTGTHTSVSPFFFSAFGSFSYCLTLLFFCFT